MRLKSSLWFVLLSCVLTCCWGLDFYVSVAGNDNNAGTIAAPFKTIEHARDVASKNSTHGPTIFIRGGLYTLESTLILSSANSGSEGHPFVIRGYENEKVQISAGTAIPKWSPVDEAIRKQYPNLPTQTVQVNLRDLGMTDFGDFGPRLPNMAELFCDGEAMQVARYPNGVGNWSFTVGTPTNRSDYPGPIFTYKDQRTARWTNAPDLWLHGYFAWDWSDSFTKVDHINVSHSEIVLDKNSLPQYGIMPDRRYYALNLLEELDVHGEYFIDRKTGILYFYPPSSNPSCFVSDLSSVVSVRGSNFITFQNLEFLYAREVGVEVTGNSIAFENCTSANHGSTGIYTTGNLNSVFGCLVYGTGSSGVSFTSGDRAKLVAGNTRITSNVIHSFSRNARTYQPGIGWYGVGNYVADNQVYDAPHVAVLGMGNDHVFERNLFHDVCYEASDAGAFYLGRSWAAQGNILRYNTFKDIQKRQITESGQTVSGLYLDDEMSGWMIDGNTFINCEVAFLLGGGRNNTVTNNMFINNGLDIEFDDRGLGWQAAYCDKGVGFVSELKSYNYQQAPWSVRYPWLVNVLNDHPCTPVYNKIVFNKYCGSGKFLSASPQQISMWLSYAANNTAVPCPR